MYKQRKRIREKVTAILLMAAMLVTIFTNTGIMQAKAAERTEVYEGGGFRVSFSVENSWPGASNVSVTIENTSQDTIENWSLAFFMPHKIINSRGAEAKYNEDNYYVIKNMGWNQDIAAGQSVQFGFAAEQDGNIQIPEIYYITSYKEKVSDSAYSVGYNVQGDWGTGHQAEITVKNESDATIEDYIMEFDYDRNIVSMWGAELIEKTGNHYIIKNPSYNQNIISGQTVSFGFLGEGGSREDSIENVEFYQIANLYDINGDYDNDGISNLEEIQYGMDVNSSDTDKDGLPDEYELNRCGTSPLDADTDGNGILDIDEDADEDSLTNLQEYQSGTDPMASDTDNDGLSDYDEINVYNTNPLQNDSDQDELSDSDDIQLGFDPLNPDTDSNGIIDGREKFEQKISKEIRQDESKAVTQVTVSMKINGNIENTVSISNMYGIDRLSTEVVGLVGVPVDIHCGNEFDEAVISFHYDKESLGKIKEENLAVVVVY